MNIGNITSDNFNLDGNGKDIQIEVYEQLIEQLQQENKELKQKYLNAVADYETTMFEKEQLNSLVNSCQEEIRRLKKQLEEKNKPQIFIDIQDMEERYSEGLYQDYLEEENKKYKNQQKEFIEWLENMLDDENDIFSVVRVKDVLQKYKSIIGDVK